MAPPLREPARRLAPRDKGALGVILGVLLIAAAIVLLGSATPSEGDYYNRWVVLFVMINTLAGYGLFFQGVWRIIVGPGEKPISLLFKGLGVLVLVVVVLTALLAALILYDITVHPYSEGY